MGVLLALSMDDEVTICDFKLVKYCDPLPFIGCMGMPCKTYDLSVKVRPWEFGSSPT